MTRPGFRKRQLSVFVLALLATSTTLYAQREFRELLSAEREWVELPDDWHEPGEFVVGRLMYPPSPGCGVGGGDWTQGGTSWSVDYPRGDRTFVRLLERLTVIDVRSVEQPVNLDDPVDAFYWPFMISGLVGAWDLTDGQAAKLREYLLRGGF
ncbi:MAG: DUF4159 domain-containing protein, partial [Gammaproteobacteria bacterium]|nr:DUF4159 domain-containing protein [Gammaproteobacteria bacterium]